MDAILSLGSNLGDRLAHLVQAREALGRLPQTRLVASSRIYVTEPVGASNETQGVEPGLLPAFSTLNAQRSTFNAQPNFVQTSSSLGRSALDAKGGEPVEPVGRWPLKSDNLGVSGKYPEFFNAIVVLETALEVHALSDAVHAIETRMGRKREADRNAPRVIDIDLICCDGLQLDEPALQLPHPCAHTRRFVCEPLTELRPNLVLPGQHLPILAILAHLPASPCVSIAAEQWR
jgi:2-amino-4-hydroxy-6-hydroxymethyldihydropteridine diphosphokinase